ncbi:hypothetical protein J6590_005896 [Homalodisca vitripennis]|nr:hypothetical protein J6590_005896 [Homalodisca vitripennis]
MSTHLTCGRAHSYTGVRRAAAATVQVVPVPSSGYLCLIVTITRDPVTRWYLTSYIHVQIDIAAERPLSCFRLALGRVLDSESGRYKLQPIIPNLCDRVSWKWEYEVFSWWKSMTTRAGEFVRVPGFESRFGSRLFLYVRNDHLSHEDDFIGFPLNWCVSNSFATLKMTIVFRKLAIGVFDRIANTAVQEKVLSREIRDILLVSLTSSINTGLDFPCN